MRIENSGGKKVFNSSISPRGGKKFRILLGTLQFFNSRLSSMLFSYLKVE